MESVQSAFITVSGTELVSADYLQSGSVINRRIPPEKYFVDQLTDRQNSTCINVSQSHQRKLQAVFTFPNSNISRDMSVNVMMKNVEDCVYPFWTWFVGSECEPRHFLECFKTVVQHVDGNMTCGITCLCSVGCTYLYLKFDNFPGSDDYAGEICEIYLMPGPVEPSALKP